MKTQIRLLTIFLLLFLGSCGSDCDNGIDCCNPQTSKLIITDYLKDWFPYDSLELIGFTSQNSQQAFFEIINLEDSDTSLFQGDECPNRPSEFRSGILTVFNDTLSFVSDLRNRFLVEVDRIQFGIYDSPKGKVVVPLNEFTSVKMVQSDTIISKVFSDLIVAESDSGSIRKLYLSHKIGVVGINRNDTVYELH